MERKKLANEHSLEELLELANTEEKIELQPVDPIFKDVRSFALAFNLKNGNNLVPNRVLYRLYKNWSSDPIRKPLFVELLGNLYKTSSHGKYVWISESSVNVSLKLYERLKDKRKFSLSNPRHRTHLQTFFNANEIKDGDKWVASYILFYMYDKWCYDNKKALRFSEKNFKNVCKSYFKHNKNTQDDGIYFRLSESIFNHITEDTINNLKEVKRKQYGRKKEKDTKKPDKIPST